MAGWTPSNNKVADSEVVGRRIFDDPLFNGSLSQGTPFKLRVDHFFDKKLEEDLSVDRLGRSGSSEAAAKRLTGKLAQDEAVKRTKSVAFLGWGVMRVKSLRTSKMFKGALDVLPKPITEEPRNPYHAEITRAAYRQEIHAWGLAASLRDIAEKDLGFEQHADASAPSSGSPESTEPRGLVRTFCEMLWAAIRRVLKD